MDLAKLFPMPSSPSKLSADMVELTVIARSAAAGTTSGSPSPQLLVVLLLPAVQEGEWRIGHAYHSAQFMHVRTAHQDRRRRERGSDQH